MTNTLPGVKKEVKHFLKIIKHLSSPEYPADRFQLKDKKLIYTNGDCFVVLNLDSDTEGVFLLKSFQDAENKYPDYNLILPWIDELEFSFKPVNDAFETSIYTLAKYNMFMCKEYFPLIEWFINATGENFYIKFGKDYESPIAFLSNDNSSAIFIMPCKLTIPQLI